MESKSKMSTSDEVRPADQFLAELQSFMRLHHPKNSKIIQAISTGTASRQALQSFAKEVCAYSASSLRPIAALVSNAPDDASFQLVLENFASEAGFLNTPPHPALFRDFTLATGVTEEELDNYVPLSSTLAAIYTLERFLRGPFDEAIAGFGFAIEGPAAEWGKLVHYGLKNHYLLDEKGMMFWTVHFEADEEKATLEKQHAENARCLMQRIASTREQQERIGKAFMHSALIFENFWTGMDRFLETTNDN